MVGIGSSHLDYAEGDEGLLCYGKCRLGLHVKDARLACGSFRTIFSLHVRVCFQNRNGEDASGCVRG